LKYSRPIFRLPKVHPGEISKEWLETLGFRAAGRHLLYAATLRPFDKLRVALSTSKGEGAVRLRQPPRRSTRW